MMAGKPNLRQDMAQKFLDALKGGRIPWHACWQQVRPMNPTTGKLYRGVNALYLSYWADEFGYADPRWCTYKQAHDKGWQVKKGAKAVPVEYWAYYDREQKKLLKWEEVRRLLQHDPEYEKNLQLSCRTYPVFNAEQIEGIPALERRGTDIGAIRAQRDILLYNMGLGYREDGNEAYYNLDSDTVTLPQESSFDDAYAYMCTFLHECGHATGHPSRLNRDMSGGFGSAAYAREELRAEIASAFTAQALELQMTEAQLQEHMQQHIAYVQSWIEVLEEQPEELFRAIKVAEEISDYLIEKGQFEIEQQQAVTYTLSQLPDGGTRLEIAGNGEIPDFEDLAARPFQDGVADIREVIIGDGITEVGTQAFRSLPALEKVSWGGNVQRIGRYIMEDCPNLREIEFASQAGSVQPVVAPSELLALATQYPQLTREQLVEIAGGFHDGLSPEQVAVYAKPEFTAIQMNSIRYSFGCLTPEQITLQANPAFDSVQMDIIRSAFQSDMTMEQVKSFALPAIPAQQMLEAYWAIRDGETLSFPPNNRIADCPEP